MRGKIELVPLRWQGLQARKDVTEKSKFIFFLFFSSNLPKNDGFYIKMKTLYAYLFIWISMCTVSKFLVYIFFPLMFMMRMFM